MKGSIYSVSGPVVVAKGLESPRMYDVVRVGDAQLIGEIIKLNAGNAIIQVYEDTSGLRPGEPVENTDAQLSVVLAPGLIGSIFDGIQRPLDKIKQKSGDFIARGVNLESIDMKKKWHFVPKAENGKALEGGAIIGEVQETSQVLHKIMLAPGLSGKISGLKEGDYCITEQIASLEGSSGKQGVRMLQSWPVRRPRPVLEKLMPGTPLITGQRVIDTFFPVAKGGTAAIPGGFGTGKTQLSHQLAKWSDSDIVIYIGCGERGNEMTEILTTFPELKDPKSGRPLMERTVLIANTSNMPVAAREASVYTGITLAEYYRDMGYSVALMADSTSRWAEALREISGRLEEMPGEEGYPAYLGRKVAEFYERAGMVQNMNHTTGSITVVGAVSPPGGDTSEPVSQNTLRATRVFWALDSSLASRRHFPAINWLNSYSLYMDTLSEWYAKNVGAEMTQLRDSAMSLLQQEFEINEVVQLVGYDALPEKDKEILDIARSVREDYLQQSAFDEVDTFASMRKQYLMLKSIMLMHSAESAAIAKGVAVDQLQGIDAKEKIAKMKYVREAEITAYSESVSKAIDAISAIEPAGD